MRRKGGEVRHSRWVAVAAALGCVLLALASSRPGSAADTYRLHTGDQINVVVYGEAALSGPQTILPDGNIQLPLVGRVHVSGQTPEQAAQTITTALQKYVRHPVVTVAVTQQGPINVLVLGDVKNPGKYALQPAGSMLSDAIAAAGGMGPTDGPYPDARIANANGTGTTQASLQKLLHDGDLSANVTLQDGEVVYIPSPQTINIYVAGAVDHPGELQLNEGDSLAIAIVKAGNSPGANGDLNHITVTRMLPNGQKQQFGVNLYKVLEPGGSGLDPVMQKGDLVFVPEVNKNAKPAGIIGQTFFYLTAGLRALFPGGILH